MKKTAKYIMLLLTMVGMLGLCACGGSGGTGDTKTTSGTSDEQKVESVQESAQESEEEEIQLLTGKHHVDIVVKDYGTISLELDADIAPISVTNFVILSQAGFYDGLTFHRIIDGFMIQGGDPLGNGTGGTDYNIPGEFSANGYENPIKHVRGTISMARATGNNTASSQFFIMHEDAPHLDGMYAGFGHVTSGIEVVDALCKDTPVQDDNGTVAPKDQPVIEKITVID